MDEGFQEKLREVQSVEVVLIMGGVDVGEDMIIRRYLMRGLTSEV